MVGVLTALRGTRLYQRLEQEGRLLKDSCGDNTAIDINFVPRMPPEALIAGYQKILDHDLCPQAVLSTGDQAVSGISAAPQGRFHYAAGVPAGALFKSMLFLGVIGRERLHFWKLFFWSLLRKPRLFPLAITYAVYGYHFRKVAEKISGLRDVRWQRKLA
jgi:hypothetical protein